MSNRRKAQLALLFYMLSMITCIGIIRKIAGLHKVEKEPTQIEEFYDNATVITEEPEKYVFHMVSDTTDVNAEIDSLGITEDECLPYDCFKVFRYVNNDGYERITIVKTYVNFVTDENKNITGYYYTMFDAFNGQLLYTTAVNKNSFMNLDDITDGDVKYIMDYDELSELKEIAISKGMDEGYVNSVMPDNLDKRHLTTYEVASYYVQLVNKPNRNNSYQTMHLG
jgi:hypothetical protein